MKKIMIGILVLAFSTYCISLKVMAGEFDPFSAATETNDLFAQVNNQEEPELKLKSVKKAWLYGAIPANGLGTIYAGKPILGGVLLAGEVAGALLLIYHFAVANKSDNSGEDFLKDSLALGAGATLMTATYFIDLLLAPHLAKKHNKKVLEQAESRKISPYIISDPKTDSYGAGIAVRF